MPITSTAHHMKMHITKEQMHFTREKMHVTKERMHFPREKLHVTKEKMHFTKESLLDRSRRPPYESYHSGHGDSRRGGREFGREGGGHHRSEPYYNPRERREGNGRRSPRSGRNFGVPRDTIMNGSYSDYMREFHRNPQMSGGHGHMPYGPPPPDYPMGPPPPGYGFDRRGDYPPMGYSHSSHSRSRSGGSQDKRDYDRDVEAFLRRTHSGSSSGRDRERDSRREHRSRRDHHR